jgi:hypothetical protein
MIKTFVLRDKTVVLWTRMFTQLPEGCLSELDSTSFVEYIFSIDLEVQTFATLDDDFRNKKCNTHTRMLIQVIHYHLIHKT